MLNIMGDLDGAAEEAEATIPLVATQVRIDGHHTIPLPLSTHHHFGGGGDVDLPRILRALYTLILYQRTISLRR